MAVLVQHCNKCKRRLARFYADGRFLCADCADALSLTATATPVDPYGTAKDACPCGGELVQHDACRRRVA